MVHFFYVCHLQVPAHHVEMSTLSSHPAMEDHTHSQNSRQPVTSMPDILDLVEREYSASVYSNPVPHTTVDDDGVAWRRPVSSLPTLEPLTKPPSAHPAHPTSNYSHITCTDLFTRTSLTKTPLLDKRGLICTVVSVLFSFHVMTAQILQVQNPFT